MKFVRGRGVFVTLTAVLTLSVGQIGSFAAAATTKAAQPAANNNSSTLKISPLRTDLTVKAGESGIVKVYVTNLTKTSVILKPIENDFVAGDEKGTPAIILDPNSFAPTHSLKRFMLPVANVTIASGATQEVDVKVSVPKTAQAGGYFGAVRFAPAGSSNQQVDLSGSVSSLVLLTVPGPVTERLTLTNFEIQQNGGSGSNFRTPDNLALLIRFQNAGNIQEAPFGQINVQKGKKILYSANFNAKTPKDEVLPDSARRWLVPIKKLGKFGKYTVSATFGYGAQGQTINISKSVWIVPTVVILIIVGIVLGVGIIVAAFWFMHRNYKRRILKSSRRRY